MWPQSRNRGLFNRQLTFLPSAPSARPCPCDPGPGKCPGAAEDLVTSSPIKQLVKSDSRLDPPEVFLAGGAPTHLPAEAPAKNSRAQGAYGLSASPSAGAGIQEAEAGRPGHHAVHREGPLRGEFPSLPATPGRASAPPGPGAVLLGLPGPAPAGARRPPQHGRPWLSPQRRLPPGAAWRWPARNLLLLPPGATGLADDPSARARARARASRGRTDDRTLTTNSWARGRDSWFLCARENRDLGRQTSGSWHDGPGADLCQASRKMAWEHCPVSCPSLRVKMT
ncbi:basic proline-rich protein-like [Pipistrellus kuhlii]|uniref:basic proline-rich protein-like n=1 Tax=Pipistrellus kuhlii TaxID=59472 RepID=UPI001E27177A|nr:basic proline-rich protein-like [Pipistrellus kuhlii]